MSFPVQRFDLDVPLYYTGLHQFYIDTVISKTLKKSRLNKASQAIQSPHTVLLFLLISLLEGYSFANVHVKGIVAFKH